MNSKEREAYRRRPEVKRAAALPAIAALKAEYARMIAEGLDPEVSAQFRAIIDRVAKFGDVKICCYLPDAGDLR